MDSDQTNLPVPTASAEEQNLKAAAEIAAYNLLLAQQELGVRLVDPNVTTKTILDIAEHSFKVSGMAKKQEPKADNGAGFSIVFNFPDGSGVSLEKPTSGAVVDVTPQRLVDEIKPVIDWSAAPEFTEVPTNALA